MSLKDEWCLANEQKMAIFSTKWRANEQLDGKSPCFTHKLGDFLFNSFPTTLSKSNYISVPGI